MAPSRYMALCQDIGQKKNREEHFYNVLVLVKEQVIPHYQLHRTVN